jgi:hypothetical protein
MPSFTTPWRISGAAGILFVALSLVASVTNVLGSAAILGSAALVENAPTGLFATINGFAWLGYFLWLAVLSMELIRVRDIPTDARFDQPA